MKRRNAECGKLRRPIKRNKITDGMYGSNTFLYVKYLILWAVVITADFMLDFRFEFLWPFWLLLRSVYDSFKYKGLAFSILFVCIAITSDLVCLFFIPVSWLFFLASTYVWVQYVWHADKGFCWPTIFLWMLFLYLEGAVRWRDDSKSIPHVDLCRPFAAHCIGYPVVTLGFGVKSYVGYRIRHRKQREVSKENEFYMQLLHLALPSDDPNQDKLMSQMRQTPELLHSDKLGDIDLPVSSAIIAQRIQQQQLLLMATSSASSTSASTISTASTISLSINNGTSTQSANATNNVNHKNNCHTNHMGNKTINSIIGNGFTLNGLTTSMSGTTIAQPAVSTGAAGTGNTNTTINHFHHHTNLSHSNNNNNNNNSHNNNVNNTNNNSATATATTQNGIGPTTHNHHHNNNTTTASSSSLSSIINFRNNRRSVDRSDKSNNDPVTLSRSTTNGLNTNFKSDANQSTKSRSAYQLNLFREAGKLTESITSSILSTIKFKFIGSVAVTGSEQHTKQNDNESNDTNSISNSLLNNTINNLASTNTINTSSPFITSLTSISPSNSLVFSSVPLSSSSSSSLASLSSTVIATSAVNTINNATSITSSVPSPSIPFTMKMSGDNQSIRGNKESRNANNDGHNQIQQMQQHNNVSSLSANGGKEKSGSKSNGNADFEINLYQENSNNMETAEKSRGRRNRTKQKDVTHIQTVKDNHSNHHITSASHVPEIKENGSVHQSITSMTPMANLSPLPQICDSCNKFESEIKKCRTEISQLKQIENELRQKCEQNNIMKSCLQVKQKENDELEKKMQEMITARQLDRQNMQHAERRAGEERRQKQSLETQLNSERKQRKQAEEKAARADCNESCKMRKQMLETECKQLRRELMAADDLKKSAEQQSRNYEQEIRKFEAELRTRESREGTEVLMSALQAMQDKNSTLEKNLSAETRVKLDLFSALGEAKRQLEIRENVIRQKDKEVLELKAKIAQLYAVMPSVPNESFITQCSSTGSSILRLNDASLQGPVSPMSHAHMSLGGSPLMNQLQNLSVFTSTSSSTPPQTTTSQIPTGGNIQSQQQQQQQNININVNGSNNGNVGNNGNGGGGSSNLDPNATAYTPKIDA